jgi:esterase
MDLSFQLWKSEQEERAKILLLHGMGGTGQLWRPIAASLESDHSLLAPDQRGHGGSRLATPSAGRGQVEFTPLEYGRDVIQLLRRLQFHPAWVIGHSMGVRTACAVAHLEPAWVRGLVLVDLGFSGAAGGGLGDDLASFLRLLPLEFASRAEARAFMTANCPDPAIGQYLMAVSVSAPDGRIEFPFDRGALIETIHAARDSSVRGWLEEAGRRGMPVLALRGAESRVWARDEFEAERQRFAGFPSVRFEEVPGTGHGLPFEKRGAFVARLREFMTS